jgi:RNA polymerase sigma-70 factor (ECF subfamily)
MERHKYISLVGELRQIAVTRASALLNDNDMAEDVSEEVLMRLWEKHRDLHDVPDDVKHLADTMARNLSLNLLRHQRRHPVMRIFQRQKKEEFSNGSDVTLTLTDDLKSTPQQFVEDKEAADILLRAMGKLPYKWRKIVEMREWEQMSFAEIADVLGTTESSCRGMMSKARKRLLQLINTMT